MDDVLEDLTECPMACAHCESHGYCDDCLDCLYWPEPYVPPPPNPRRTVYGHAEPSLALEAADLRRDLRLPDIVPIAIRRYRREHRLSQRALAAEMGWSRSLVARAETTPMRLSLGQLLRIVTHSGHQLVVTTADGTPFDPVDASTPELLARDAAGRRLPPYGESLRRDESDRLTQADGVRHDGRWTWRHPA